jgi:hypothetical protein
MKYTVRIQIFFVQSLLIVALTGLVKSAYGNPAKEFLTEKEIEQIQIAQEIHLRVKLYLEFAALRLKTAEERLSGKESEPGDPFEFFSPEEMVDGYYRILDSVMLNVDAEFQESDENEKDNLRKALKSLKGSTENALKLLEVLKKIAEEKQKETLWDMVNRAIDITRVAREGAQLGLSKYPDPLNKKTREPHSNNR